MERKSPIDRARENVSLAEDMLKAIIFVENPESVNLYPKDLAKIRDYFDEIASRPEKELPMPHKYYEDEFRAINFLLMVFSSTPEKSWSQSELYKIADFSDKYNNDIIYSALIHLNLQGMVKTVPDRKIKILETV